ncbi:glycosyltransferase [bacterium]|nr:glycosyltransferase [bacterium]
MKVLSFSYCFPNAVRPTWGIFIAQRLAALSQREDVELEICAPVPTFPIVSHLQSDIPPLQETKSGLTVHHPRYFYVPKFMKHLDGKFYARGLLPWVRNYCKRSQPKIFDAHFAWPDGVGVYHLSRKLNIPYVVTLRGWIWVGMKQPKLWNQATEALQNAHAIINLCKPMADVCKKLGCEEQRLHIVHNGVDRKLFHPIDRAAARKILGLPQDLPLIVCVAYFQRRKGILEVIRAFAKLPFDTHLVLVGASVEADYYKEVLQTISKLGLANRVIMPGPQPYHLIPLYLNAANVTVLVSYWEGCPNVVVESLGCGTPVIATPVGSVPEQIIPGKNGYIVPMKNPDILAEALKKALSQNWNRQQLSASIMSWDDIARKVQKILHKAVYSSI